MNTKTKFILLSGIAILAGSINSHAVLVAYDGLNGTVGPLDGQSTGTNWAEAWFVQNDDPVYTVASVSPLSYGSLQSSGNYGQGGGGYLYGQHKVLANFGSAANTAGLVSSPFGDQMIDQGTVWTSLLVRRNTSESGIQIGFSGSDVTSGTPSGAYFSLNGGNWSLRQGGIDQGALPNNSTGVAATVGDTYFMVMKYTLSLAGTSTVDAWVNPVSLGGADLTSPLASLSIASNTDARFRMFGLYTGGSTGALSFDEIRIGTSYADVSPIPEPTTWALLAGGLTVLTIFRRRRA